MKHKELKELKKLLEKEKISDKTLKNILETLENLSKSNKTDFKKAEEFCSNVIKKKKLDKKVSKKIVKKIEKLSKSLKKKINSTKSVERKVKAVQKTSNRVTKPVVVQTISEKASLTKKDANIALNSILETITDSLSKGDSVTLIGFGTFSSETKATRNGFNPYTKTPMTIPEHKIAHFRVGAKLKEALK